MFDTSEVCVASETNRCLGPLVASLFALPAAHAADDNQAVLDAWARANGSAPAVVAQPDGATRLEWQVQSNNEAYSTSLQTAGNPTINSPLQDGSHGRATLATSVKQVTASGTTFLQAAVLGTDDRAVLSKYANQVTTLQAGRTTATYSVLAGDVAANFSTLGTNLGLRGLLGTVTLGPVTVSSHIGTVSESWEALANRGTIDNTPARNSFLRDVFGVKAEYALSPSWKAFVTTQGYNDRASSLPGLPSTRPAETQSNTLGLAYQGEALQVSAETGTSRFGQSGDGKRDGNATVLAGTYRVGNVYYRAGYNDIGPLFASLAAAAAPGAQESYAGADWQATQALTLGAELRHGANRVAATEITEATRSPFDALSVRAGYNLNAWVEGLGLQAQDTRSRNEDPVGNRRDNSTTALGLNYGRNGWTAVGGATYANSKDRANASSDSTTRSWQAGGGKQWSGDPAGPPWNLSVNALGTWQVQRLVAMATETRNRNFALSVSGTHARFGAINVMAQAGTMTQPQGGPDLRQRGYQLEYSYPITPAALLRAYWRRTERNGGSDTLRTVEESGGANFSLTY